MAHNYFTIALQARDFAFETNFHPVRLSLLERIASLRSQNSTDHRQCRRSSQVIHVRAASRDWEGPRGVPSSWSSSGRQDLDEGVAKNTTSRNQTSNFEE
jgi:hypothetical protein